MKALENTAPIGTVPLGESLGGGHHVRLDVEIVDSERRRQAAEAGDDFVEDQQDAVLGANLAQALQVALGRDQHAGRSRHRFDDDGGDGRGVVQRDDAFQLVGQFGAVFRLAARVRILRQVVRVRQVVDARQQRAEGLAVVADAAHRQAAEADPVVAALAPDQAGASALAARLVVGQRDLQRGIDGFRAGVGIEHLAELVVRVVHQPLGQLEGGRMAHLEGGRVVELAGHFADRGGDLRLAVAARHAPQAGGAVEHLLAVDVAVIHALGRSQQARLGLEITVVGEWHPERGHGCRFRRIHKTPLCKTSLVIIAKSLPVGKIMMQ
jgi:hypothetical protein